MRRPTAKGKGADIFLGDLETTASLPRQEAVEKEKASFYFTQDLLDALDQTWMQLRMKDRKLTKSDLVQAALEEMIREYQQRQEDSRLYQRLVARPHVGH
jgi:hypothetical protein